MIIVDPREIEAKSFAIIDNYIFDANLPKDKRLIIRRVIHASTSFSYVKDLIFHPRAIREGLKAIKSGRNIIVDSSMVAAGINRRILSGFGGKVVCRINDRDIISRSDRLNITRAILSIRKSIRPMDGGIVAIGNAPTALSELCDLVTQGKARPSLIVGVPVGFVGAKEVKKRLTTLDIPYITNRSRRGGSSIACSIVNALLEMA